MSVAPMESSHMECDGMNAMPFLKREPDEFPVNFLFSDNNNTLDQSSSNSEQCQDVSGLLPSSSGIVVPPQYEISSIKMDAEEKAKPDGLHSQASCLGVQSSESVSSMRFDTRNGVAQPSSFSSSSSCHVVDISQVCNLNPFDIEVPVTATQFLQSPPYSHDKEQSFHCKEATDPGKNVFNPSETMRDCVAVPAEQLSESEQTSIKTDEIFTNVDEEQCHSDMPDRATILECVHSGASTESTKEMPAVGSVKSVEDVSIFVNNGKTEESGRRRKKKTESPHAVQRALATECCKEQGTTKNHRPTDSDEAEQKAQSNPNNCDRANFQRTRSKVCERKRSLQSKCPSVSSLTPQACRIQVQRPVELKLLQGLGIKKYLCTVCKASFNRRQHLRRHVLEVHEGKPRSDNGISDQPVSMTFTCPLCSISYSRKYRLKRHFESKHLNTTKIPCPECKYKAKTLALYLQHIVKHKPKQPEAQNSSPVQNTQFHSSQLRCRECFRLFENSDALRLHVIDHKILPCMSEVELFLESNMCSCISNEDNASYASSLCALHMPHSNLSLKDSQLLSCLPHELKLEVEHSLATILKLTSQLKFLADFVCTLNTRCTSDISLTALNHISTLSPELTNLSVTLWHVLQCHGQKKEVECINKESVVDSAEGTCDSQSEVGKEGTKIPVVLENDSETIYKKVEGLVEEASNGLVQEKNKETFITVQDGELVQEIEEHSLFDKNMDAIFQQKNEEFVQENGEQVVVEENIGEVFQEEDKGSVPKRDRQKMAEEGVGEIVPEEKKEFIEESYEGLVLEEVDDFILVEDVIADKFSDDPAKESRLGQVLSGKPPRKNTKSSKRLAVIEPSSEIKTRRSKRQALKASKASVPQSLPASKHSKVEAKEPRREHSRLKLQKMLDDTKSSMSGDSCKCRVCGKSFTNVYGLRRHLRIHTDYRPFKCKVCSTSFHRNDYLRRHMVKHSDERLFKCNLCDYAAKTSSTLNGHLLTHRAHQRFPCKKCSYKGRNANELSKHELKHNPCPLCSYVASDMADYKLHKRSHVVYSCTECNYSCYANWQLKRHAIKHKALNDIEKLSCELCGYSCFDKGRLAYHMTRHQNKTPFSCSICDYKCSSRASFHGHKLMHAGLKPYLCSICGASFRRSSTLNNHMLVHKEEKQHVCRTCGRPFRALQNLKAHMMIHTGERKYKCQLCNFACRRNRELTAHMNKHKLVDGDEKDSKTPCDSKAS